MKRHLVSVSALVKAPVQLVYAIIADYREGHPSILPRPYFVSMHIDKGGIGEGTVINFQMKLMGRLQTFRAAISEPEPGKTLVETDLDTGTVTTFSLEPSQNGQHTHVTISTSSNIPDGITGKIQGWLTTQLLRPIYVKELAQLEAVAEKELQHHAVIQSD